MTTKNIPIMEDHRMVHKANQIASFFAAYPHEKAVEGVLTHIRKFWTPPMRVQLKDYIAAGKGGDLHELVIEAADHLNE